MGQYEQPINKEVLSEKEDLKRLFTHVLRSMAHHSLAVSPSEPASKIRSLFAETWEQVRADQAKEDADAAWIEREKTKREAASAAKAREAEEKAKKARVAGRKQAEQARAAELEA